MAQSSYGLAVRFPGMGKLNLSFLPGQTLGEFMEDAEEAFQDIHGCAVEVKALVHPAFLPEDEVVLPRDAKCMLFFGNLTEVVAKWCYCGGVELQSQSPAAASSSRPKPAAERLSNMPRNGNDPKPHEARDHEAPGGEAFEARGRGGLGLGALDRDGLTRAEPLTRAEAFAHRQAVRSREALDREILARREALEEALRSREALDREVLTRAKAEEEDEEQEEEKEEEDEEVDEYSSEELPAAMGRVSGIQSGTPLMSGIESEVVRHGESARLRPAGGVPSVQGDDSSDDYFWDEEEEDSEMLVVGVPADEWRRGDDESEDEGAEASRWDNQEADDKSDEVLSDVEDVGALPDSDVDNLSALSFSDEELPYPKGRRGLQREEVDAEVQMRKLQASPSLVAANRTMLAQKQIQRDIQQRHVKSEWKLRSLPKERQQMLEDTFELLQPLGYERGAVLEVIQECDFHPGVVTQYVERVVSEVHNSWEERVTRKHRRDMQQKSERDHQARYLAKNLVNLLQDLPPAKATARGNPEVTPEITSSSAGAVVSRARPMSSETPAERLEEKRKQWARSHVEDPREPASAAMKQNEVAQRRRDAAKLNDEIASMSRRQCGDLLRNLKTLSHVPIKLYQMLADRAVQEYVALVKPVNFFDAVFVSFWEFAQRGSKVNPEVMAGAPFFQCLCKEGGRGTFLNSLRRMSPVCVVYMLWTMHRADQILFNVLNTSAEYILETISSLDRLSLGSFAWICAECKAKGIQWVYPSLAQEVIRRCEMEESALSLAPDAIKDLFWAFSQRHINCDAALAALKARTVALFDADMTGEYIEHRVCAATQGGFGKKPRLAKNWKLHHFLTILRALNRGGKVHHTFFSDVADFIVYCLEHSEKVVNRFIEKPGFCFAQLLWAYAEAGIPRPDLVAALKKVMQQHRAKVNQTTHAAFAGAAHYLRELALKKDRQQNAPPLRERGGVGRREVPAGEAPAWAAWSQSAEPRGKRLDAKPLRRSAAHGGVR